ncbi:MAG: hypothetical protein ACREIF_02550 [Chthoniobacterales bacterium]
MQKIIRLGKAAAHLSEFLFVMFRLLAGRLQLLPSDLSSLLGGFELFGVAFRSLPAGFEFLPSFLPHSFELSEKLVSLRLFSLKQVIQMGIGLLKLLDPAIAPINLGGGLDGFGGKLLAEPSDRLLMSGDLFPMLHLGATAQGEFLPDIFVVGDTGPYLACSSPQLIARASNRAPAPDLPYLFSSGSFQQVSVERYNGLGNARVDCLFDRKGGVASLLSYQRHGLGKFLAFLQSNEARDPA